MGRIELDETKWINGHGYRKNRLANEILMACQGTLVQMVVIDPGDFIPDHVHLTSTEFYFVIEGECHLFLDDEFHKLKKGDMFLTKPGDVHRLYNKTDMPFFLLVFKTNATEQDTFWQL